jgi:hypothetical protein
MDPDQNSICQFLKSWPDQFVSRREICRRAGGKWRYREDENWAVPVLQRMLENRVIECDDTSHFRLLREETAGSAKKRKLWLSPAIRSMLKRSGRNFEVIDLDKEPETAAQMANPEPLLSYQADFQERTTQGSASTRPPG